MKKRHLVMAIAEERINLNCNKVKTNNSAQNNIFSLAHKAEKGLK